jgi:hypothetical protein
MFLKLVRSDHTIHYGPWWLAVAAPIGVVLAAMSEDGLTPGVEGDYVGPVMLIWVLVTMMLGYAQIGLRAEKLGAGLPLNTRTLWLARVTSILVFAVSILVISAVFMAVLNGFERRTLVHGDALSFLLSLSSVVLFAVALAQSVRPAIRELPTDRRTIIQLIVIWAASTAMLFALIPSSPGWAIALAVFSLALLALTWGRLPKAFVVTDGTGDTTVASVPGVRPGETSTAASLRAASAVTPGSRGKLGWRWLLGRTIVSTLYRPIAAFIAVGCILVFLGFYTSGFYPENLSGPVYLFWITGLSPVLIVWPSKHVFKLEFLPVSRRRLFPFVVLPGIALVFAGFVGGTVIGNVFAPHPPLREYVGTRDCCFYTRVPDRFLEIAWDGSAAGIVSPWGETHEPWACRPIEGKRALLYSPYSIPADCSRRFAAWQVSREINDIYGLAVTAEAIENNFERYFETRDDGTYALRSWGDPLRADFPGMSLLDWVRPMAAIVLILGVVWFLVAGWVIRAFFTSGRSDFLAMLARVLPALVPIAFVVVIIWSGEFGYTTSWKLTALANALVRYAADLLPSNPLALWCVVTIILMAAYLVAERTFRNAQAQFGNVDK